MTALAHGVRLARIDVSRMRRKHTNWRSSSSSVFGLLAYVAMVAAGTLGGGYIGYRAGRVLDAAGGAVDPAQFATTDVVRGIVTVFWLVLAAVYALRAVGQRGELAQPEGILTVVPTREAFLGVLLAEYAYFLLWVLLPAVGVGSGFALGAGVVWPVLAVPVAVAAAGVGSVGVGYPIGLGIRHVASRFAFVIRHKNAIVALLFVAYFVALSTGAWNRLMGGLFDPMQRSPVGWYADLLFLGTPALDAAPLYAGGALVLSLALAVFGVVVGTRVAERHWFSDPADAGSAEPDRDDAGEGEPGLERRLAPTLGPATAALITLSWRRARRSPLKLLYAFYPALFLVGIFAEVVQTGEVPAYLPYVILLFAAWAAGVIFTLNPLGDQGAALSSTLLSHVDGRTFVRAHLLAGLVVAVPISTVATGLVAYLSPLERQTALALVVAAPILMVVSAGLSVGIGVAFPRFEATNVTRSMKTVLPSRWAFVLYTAHLAATAAAAVLATHALARDLAAGLLSWALPFGLSVTPETLYPAAVVVLVPLLLAPVVSYRYAVARYDGYTLA